MIQSHTPNNKQQIHHNVSRTTLARTEDSLSNCIQRAGVILDISAPLTAEVEARVRGVIA